MLWYINNEYRKRLAQAQTCLGLLVQLLQRVEQTYPETLLVLRYASEEIAALTDEHRLWRHQFYYDPSASGRMVQSERDINRALSQFHRMRTHHTQRLQNLRDIFAEAERPAHTTTSIARGDDLWEKAMGALEELDGFRDYLEGLRT
jgi:hypothetical protein